MRAIFIVMLVVQVAIVLASAWAIAGRRPTPARPRPIWSSLTVSLVLCAIVSLNIAGRHELAAGAELVRFGGGVLIGLGIACALMGLRERRGLDRPL